MAITETVTYAVFECAQCVTTERVRGDSATPLPDGWEEYDNRDFCCAECVGWYVLGRARSTRDRRFNYTDIDLSTLCS